MEENVKHHIGDALSFRIFNFSIKGRNLAFLRPLTGASTAMAAKGSGVNPPKKKKRHPSKTPKTI